MLKEYLIEVQTGSVENAGTGAHVYVQLIRGTPPNEHRSEELFLDNPYKNDFERGNTDQFTITTEDFGWIDGIRVFHDNRGDKPGWFLNYVKVKDKKVGLDWQANFYRWLAKGEGDGEIDVTTAIPLTVDILDGVLKTYFLGYQVRRSVNDGPADLTTNVEFSFTKKQGASIEETKTTSLKTGAELGFDFIGKAKVNVEVAWSCAKKTGSTVEETVMQKQSYSVKLTPGQSSTLILLLFQSVLEGRVIATANVRASGLSARYQVRFDLNTEVIHKNFLSDSEVKTVVEQFLSKVAGAPIAAIPSENVTVGVWQTRLDKVNTHAISGSLAEAGAKVKNVLAEMNVVSGSVSEKTILEDGRLLKEPSHPDVYVIYGGAKFHTVSPDEFEALGFTWEAILTVPDGTLTSIPNVPRDGCLLKERSRPHVYIISGGQKSHIPDAQRFDELGFAWEAVRTVPDGGLSFISDGPPV